MSRPYRNKKQLFWTICGIDLLAGLASTATAFAVVIGGLLSIAIPMALAGLEFERLAPAVQTGASIGIVLVFFVIGPGAMWASRVAVYRWMAASCPHCGQKFGSPRQENETIASGRCKKCGAPLVDESAEFKNG